MSCLLCGSDAIQIIQKFDVNELIQEWKDKFGLDIGCEFDGLTEFGLWECLHCHLRFFLPVSLVGSPELYVQLATLPWYYNMPRKWEHEVALEDLLGSRRILELGCGSGDFVALARKETGLDVEGIELNEAAVLRAQEQGLPVRCADLNDLANQESGAYDLLCSFQVLEHVPNPGEFLRASCALLQSGGKLIFGVPDGDSYIRYEHNLLDMPPHHMSRWSKKVLVRIQDLFPLRLLRVRNEPLAEYHVDGYLDTYLTRMGFPSRIRNSRVKTKLADCLKITGARRLLRGQTLYACYEKL